MNEMSCNVQSNSGPSNTRKRVALTIHSLQGGGAERLMAQLANHWAECCEVHLITWASRDTDQYSLDVRIQRHGLDMQEASRGLMSGILANVLRVRRLREILGHIRPDLLVSFCDQMNIVCLEASRRFSALPVYIAEHSDPMRQRLSPLWEAWRARSYARCTGAVTLTEEIADSMSRWISRDRIRVIPPALADNAGFDFDYRVVPECKRPTILYLGRLSPEKQVDLLLRAWSQIQPLLPEWNLQIVGDGPARQILERLGSGMPSVTFSGWTNQPEAFYRESQIFVLCSQFEGFPVALLEAMSFGLPCISTRCSSAIDRLEAEGSPSTLQIVEHSSASELAAAILEVAKVDSLRRTMSAQARKMAAKYTWEKVSPRWDALL